jgi:aryl-alcohol dehydrogenase-like predicted oxidoreductase
VPTSGTRKPERLEENLAAAGIELTPDDLRELDLVTTGTWAACAS